MPPIGSRIILSMAFGPRHVRMTSATVLGQSVQEYKVRKVGMKKMANLGSCDI